jgi:hypothetical protein
VRFTIEKLTSGHIVRGTWIVVFECENLDALLLEWEDLANKQPAETFRMRDAEVEALIKKGL